MDKPNPTDDDRQLFHQLLIFLLRWLFSPGKIWGLSRSCRIAFLVLVVGWSPLLLILLADWVIPSSSPANPIGLVFLAFLSIPIAIALIMGGILFKTIEVAGGKKKSCTNDNGSHQPITKDHR